MRWIKRGLLFLLTLVILLVFVGIGILIVQGKQTPNTAASYVALGSSFAAGVGLGERASGSPLACQRSVNGYPQELARLLGVSLSDMTCGGSTVKNILHGGQFFQGPQIDAIGPNTELVTITAGGNDIDYIGDLIGLNYRQRAGDGFVGHAIARFWHGAKPVEDRQFAQLRNDLIVTLKEIAHRAPHARIVVVTYPVILPPAGTCAQIGISSADATLMRSVGTRLAEVTREAVRETDVTLVDMDTLSFSHDACSSAPWVSGAEPQNGVPFHPSPVGTQATAKQIMLMLNAGKDS